MVTKEIRRVYLRSGKVIYYVFANRADGTYTRHKAATLAQAQAILTTLPGIDITAQ